MEFYDNLFRFWAVGLFILMGAVILRDYGLRLTATFGAISSFSAAGYLLISQPGSVEQWGTSFFFLAMLGAAAPATSWVFCWSQFDDNFRFGRGHIAVLILYYVVWFLGFGSHTGIGPDMGSISFYDLAGSLLRLLLLAHMVYVAWRGRADDLLEVRRKFRTLVVVLTTGFTGVIVVVETLFQDLRLLPEVAVFQAFSFLLFGMAMVWVGMRSEKGILFEPQQRPKPVSPVDNGGLVVVPVAPDTPDTADANDKHDLAAILAAVVDEQKFLLPGLTISTLAGDIGMPEHRLRRLINQHMGYRNFADFLNHYRIGAAKIRLANAAERHTQVLIVAMDLGYGSLGPFNRAFKERTGQTPTEFRAFSLAKTE